MRGSLFETGRVYTLWLVMDGAIGHKIVVEAVDSHQLEARPVTVTDPDADPTEYEVRGRTTYFTLRHIVQVEEYDVTVADDNLRHRGEN